MITLELFGNPIPQGRPRFYKNGKYTKCFDPNGKQKEYTRWQLRAQFPSEEWLGPIKIDLIFFMPIPTSSSRIRKLQMSNGKICHMKKPDLDNLQKFVLDCLNGIAFRDDSQIVEIRAKKIYSHSPRTLIRMLPFGEDCAYENCE